MEVKTWPNGARYHGQFKDDKRNGKGIYIWPDAHHDGEWQDDTTGQGVRTWPDGARHDGEWKDGKSTGQGVKTWPNGARYHGQFKDDKRNGKGSTYGPMEHTTTESGRMTKLLARGSELVEHATRESGRMANLMARGSELVENATESGRMAKLPSRMGSVCIDSFKAGGKPTYRLARTAAEEALPIRVVHGFTQASHLYVSMSFVHHGSFICLGSSAWGTAGAQQVATG